MALLAGKALAKGFFLHGKFFSAEAIDIENARERASKRTQHYY
jgi:hypothetical protein